MDVLFTFRKRSGVILTTIWRFVLLGSIVIMPGMGTVPAAMAQGPERQPTGIEVSVRAPVMMQTAALQVKDSAEAGAPALEGDELVFNLPVNAQRFAAQKNRAQNKAIQSSTMPVTDLASDEDAGESAMGPALAALEGDGTEGLVPNDPTGSGSFTGLDENGLIPPDTNIAAGPTNLVEVVNDEIAVYNKSGGVTRGPFTLQTWFGQAQTVRIFDPTVMYRGGRFYVVALLRNTNTQVSRILLSASRTSDAAGAWCNYNLNGEQASTNWADFPRIGATQNKILIATNQFTWAGNAFENNFLHELPKASIDACASFNFTTWFDFFNSDNSRGFTLNPVLDYDAFSASAFHIVNSIAGSGNFVTVWRRDTAAGTWSRFNIGTSAYSTPPDARQPGTATLVATNDSRILSAVKRYNKIWAVQSSALNPSCGFNISAVHVIAINAPASTSIAPTANHDLHYHGGCTLDYYFPAITVDGNGNMLMVFNRSSTGERPNVRFAGWHAASFPNQTTLIGGGGYFASKIVGAASGAFTETRGRWGDYSGISIDPVSPQQNVWVAGEILKANNVWTTRIGKIFHSPVPVSP